MSGLLICPSAASSLRVYFGFYFTQNLHVRQRTPHVWHSLRHCTFDAVRDWCRQRGSCVGCPDMTCGHYDSRAKTTVAQQDVSVDVDVGPGGNLDTNSIWQELCKLANVINSSISSIPPPPLRLF